MIAELIVGYALPGRPVAMMLFKTWGYITMSQGTFQLSIALGNLFTPSLKALTFSSDFKLGQ